ncbi:MAG: hypothetical protein ACOYN3_06130 [Acidimicrobiia bacterium]
MNERKFFDPSQPQTLQIAVLLFYFNAAFGIVMMLLGGGFEPITIVLYGLGALCAFGMANEKRIAYFGALTLAVLNLAWFLFLWLVLGFAYSPLNVALGLLFDVALVALLVHPQSRGYQKIWFR